MTIYEIYKNNNTTGDKKLVGHSYKASNAKTALKMYFDDRGIRNKKGKYLVIPHSIRSKYTIVKS